jgi:hypothetical protein
MRLDPDLRAKLEAIAKANGRSLHAEISIRLEASLRDEENAPVSGNSGMTPLQSIPMFEQIAKLNEQMKEFTVLKEQMKEFTALSEKMKEFTVLGEKMKELTKNLPKAGK